MAPEIITTAAGVLGKAASDPVKSVAMRQSAVIKTLKLLRIDPNQPPKDFESLYAYALVEALYGLPKATLRLFQDQYVQRSFARSFETDDWKHLRKEIDLAIQRNSETKEFGHLGVDVSETVSQFILKFQELVSRSRDAYATRLEGKVDNLLNEVLRTRSAEEAHRLIENPVRAESSPAERLKDDVETWFDAVGYKFERTWTPRSDCSALLVNVPTRRRGRFDRIVVLCVEGELGLHHLDLLKTLTEAEAAAEGWGVAQLRVSEAARRWSSDSQDSFSCFSFDELIDLEVDFDPYVEWLQNEVKSRRIDTRYVALSCRKEEVDPANGETLGTSTYDWEQGGLDRYVDTWLTDPTKKHLSLLGEFGMGKSWFSLHFADRLAQAWKDAKQRGVPRPRMPLVIPLRDYAKQTSVSALLSEFFFNKHKIGLRSYDVFSVLNRMGRLVLIFDGFDEMATRIDRNTMVANFWELAKAAEPGAKVLLSSRTEHFPDAAEARDLFEAKVSTSMSQIPQEGPTFEIVELIPFDDIQIQRMLSHLLSPEKIDSVMSNDDVRDLMRRPVMSELVIDALPEIESGAPINLTRIYLYAIKRKMDRDVTSRRTFTSRADKLFFLSEVASEMLRTNQLTLNYRDFPDRLRSCFGSAVENRKDLDYWEQDMRNQGMLVRNAEGDYGPSHKSLLEFLTAYKFAAELGLLAGTFLEMLPRSDDPAASAYSWSEYFSMRGADGSLPSLKMVEPEAVEILVRGFGADYFNSVVYDFLATITREHPDYENVLIRHIQSTVGRGDAAFLGGNCANLLGHAQGTLAGADLRGVDLSGFREADLPESRISLRGANLSGATLNAANLSLIDKTGTDFTDADLRGSHFLDSDRCGAMVIIHPDRAVSVFVVEETGHSEKRSVLHWADGVLSSSPEHIELAVNPTPDHDLWADSGLFVNPWSDWWGYSDGVNSFIISNETGEVLRQFEGCATGVIKWGGHEVLVLQDDSVGRGFGWKFIHATSGEVLAEPMDLHEEGASSYAYFDAHSKFKVWAKSKAWTKVFEYVPGQANWVEVDFLPVGLEHSVSSARRRVMARLMTDGDVAYLPGNDGSVVKFPAAAVESAQTNLSEAGQILFSNDNELLAISGDRSLSVWKTGVREWQKIWGVTFDSSVLRMSGDDSRLIVSVGSGEVHSYCLTTGERMSAVSLNRKLRNAKFTRSSLDDAQSLAAGLAGAIFVEK
ncbi:NACHT domain-containing protein [Streptomyces rubiginosohelvolus]|uniref:NACHT domain-containing protein n=1 Tax=Streptomyces rubiginosohelvolus TaxID=67362 RepID=UPI00386EB720|nr:NACHT domain-containing protein [Streptomyces rubiginosohelvolus]